MICITINQCSYLSVFSLGVGGIGEALSITWPSRVVVRLKHQCRSSTISDDMIANTDFSALRLLRFPGAAHLVNRE